jgi:uncharacterized protein
MKVQISEIPEDGLELDAEEPVQAEGVRIASPVGIRLRVEKIGTEVVIRGELAADVEFSCSRCLREVKKGLLMPINLLYHPLDSLRGDERRELLGEELETGFYEDDELDIEEIAKEQVLLNIPMKPLCGESCRGICPRCGADLNEGSCGCKLSAQDSRLSALKKLLEDRPEDRKEQ